MPLNLTNEFGWAVMEDARAALEDLGPHIVCALEDGTEFPVSYKTLAEFSERYGLKGQHILAQLSELGLLEAFRRGRTPHLLPKSF